MRCGCGFCALCLADCGGDAHTHYGTTHGGDIFNRRLFDETHRTRRSRLIVDAVRALAGEGGDVQRAVLRELSVDMRGLTIDEGGVAAAVFQQRARVRRRRRRVRRATRSRITCEIYVAVTGGYTSRRRRRWFDSLARAVRWLLLAVAWYLEACCHWLPLVA